MTSRFAVFSAAIVLSWAALAQDPASRKAESSPQTTQELIAQIEDELAAAQNEFFKRYRELESVDEKTKFYEEKYPKADKWFPKLYEVAKAAPKSKEAEQVLLWIVSNGGPGDGSAAALEILARDHIESKDVADLADFLGYSSSPKADELLKALEEKNPNREVKGRAVYARAQRMRTHGHDRPGAGREAELTLERVQKEFADVQTAQGTLGARAEGDLFEIRNLAIGKAAPEIVGEGIDGKPLKLGDFRGRVVVLDFWGHW
jgi:flagellar motility protein MotE (MotC chaperone)